MFGPDQAKAKAAVAAIRESIERIVAEHFLGDGADVAPSAKIIGATVVLMAAAHYARTMGLPKQMAAGVTGTTYDMAEAAESSGPNSDDA